MNIIDYWMPQSALEISESAAEAVRLKFNPGALNDVTMLKTLAASFITICENLKRGAPREFSVAITEMETAAMWAVKGATKNI